MKKLMLSIHDNKARCYSQQPSFHDNEALAQRFIQFAVNSKDPEHIIPRSPGDFTFFIVGEYDTETGQITPMEPQSLGNGLEYVSQPFPDDPTTTRGGTHGKASQNVTQGQQEAVSEDIRD